MNLAINQFQSSVSQFQFHIIDIYDMVGFIMNQFYNYTNTGMDTAGLGGRRGADFLAGVGGAW